MVAVKNDQLPIQSQATASLKTKVVYRHAAEIPQNMKLLSRGPISRDANTATDKHVASVIATSVPDGPAADGVSSSLRTRTVD